MKETAEKISTFEQWYSGVNKLVVDEGNGRKDIYSLPTTSWAVVLISCWTMWVDK